MTIKLHQTDQLTNAAIEITGSKSETNRLLLLQALYPEIEIANVSNSDDSIVMKQALSSHKKEIDIHHAGTAMRFLTAYFAIQNQREVLLTGSKRMQERPIKILVDALQRIGAYITYQKEIGYPPILIKGEQNLKSKVHIDAGVSSQYISALMLIGSSLPKGLTIHLEGKLTSVPYIQMTLHLLKDIGITANFIDNTITIQPKQVVTPKRLVVESDWSSASYFYSIVALSKDNTSITLSSYKKDSYQGDAVLAKIYTAFGVQTTFTNESITLKKESKHLVKPPIELDLSDSPDIAQTIAVTCFGLGVECHLTGLHTLKIKETDRLAALKIELEKLGAIVDITTEALHLQPTDHILDGIAIDTYQDHRMAMAFAPLALKTGLQINEAEVVSKSYPDFWSDLKNLGIKISEF
ncbi:3-phosphoshikimate 1-carboxyvinyltransferase [Aquimarina brevivitae]|uniref:3-phosphoshikimate 1-carboxyvinyltransferase n=1 Tax=Aquimarina brevivitae TaxID=323412 RepID=A0A4Q7NY85_9FLAO|nr:3-phosphoshikimate 1-carboxyvinyltransferase [Aquimarina brevivitae]RZS92207.1 3-phosphoshikimate 1-carboxyvinyltransferase [Aquimarina brevivitae]